MYDLSHLNNTSGPFLRGEQSTRQLTLDVIIGLLPALALSVFLFGLRALSLVCLSVVACVCFEWLFQRLVWKRSQVSDLSAVVTGMLLCFTLPVTVEWWMVLMADFFAIVIVKNLPGGLGKNALNPALCGRTLLAICYPTAMSTYCRPQTLLPLFSSCGEIVTQTTPLQALQNGQLPDTSITNTALGMISGCLGEVSTLALFMGGIWLLYRRTVSLRMPVAFLVTITLLTSLFPAQGYLPALWSLYQLISGGVMLAAFFMVPDPVTSPVTYWGQILYGVGCGALTVLLRYHGSDPEGVWVAILIMNAAVFVADRIFHLERKFCIPVGHMRSRAKVTASGRKAHAAPAGVGKAMSFGKSGKVQHSGSRAKNKNGAKK